MPLSDILSINVTTNAAQPTQQGFGTPLILGAVQNAVFGGDLIRYYTSLAGMVADGFLTTDPEYLIAQTIFSQNPAPPQIAVGRRTNKPTQIFKIKVLAAVVGKVYNVYIAGVKKTYTAIGGDTTTTIATALATAIGTPAGFGAATSSTDTVTLTASAAGNWLRVATDDSLANSALDVWQSHVDAGVQADLNAIFAVDSTWYAVLSPFGGTIGSTNTSEVGQIAAWVEANQRLFIAGIHDTTVLGSGTTDICSNLKALNYARTTPWYHVDNGAGLASGVAGRCLPLAPGSETWKFKTIVGPPATSLTATQQTNLESKRCNYYYSVGGISITTQGYVSDQEFVDTIRGRDWLASRLQTRILTVLANAKKIPYTDAGIAVIESEVRAQLREAIAQGYIASTPAPTITVPRMSAVSTADRQSRTLNNVSFAAQLAGAIHKLGPVNGTVTA